MGIKVLRIVLLIAIVQFHIGASCNKENARQCRGGYSFAATSEWSPQLRIYGIGDTIFLSSDIAKSLANLNNPTITIDYTNSVAIGGLIGMAYVDTVQQKAMPGRSKFDYFGITGTIGESAVAGDQGPAFTYTEQLNGYSFKCGIICKQKGIYFFSVSDLKSPGIRGKNCTNANFSMALTNTDKNLSLYQNATGIILDADGVKRGFAFRVM